MSTIRGEVEKLVVSIFEELDLDKEYGKVVKSKRPDLCQFQCNGALAVAKQAKKNPREIAGAIVDKLSDDPMISAVEIAGPGFINISVTDETLISFSEASRNDDSLHCDTTDKNASVIIDFGGPNVAKPMHVGHLRSAIIGDSLQRLFRYMGYSVTSDNHLGDWGTQMGMLISELERREPTLPYFDASITDGYPTEAPVTIKALEEMYPEASKKCKADPELMQIAIKATDELQKGRPGYVALWKHFVSLSVETLKHDFDTLDVRFDHWLGESYYMGRMGDVVTYLKEKEYAVESEGATVMHISEEGDKKEYPPVMLVKSGGGFLYATSDIATIDFRVKEWDADRICYVVDKRQSLHFEQVFRAVKKSGIAKENMQLEHIGFGTVNGKDGKPYKTREGGVMKLGDLITLVIEKATERMEEAGIEKDKTIATTIGMAALKYADLMNHRLSDYIFDIDKFTSFQGNTGPYLLYSAVRIKSILRKAAEQGFTAGTICRLETKSERDLLLELGRMNDVLVKAGEDCAPNYLCDYIYDLSKAFNGFFRDCHILREEDKELQGSWLALAELTLKAMLTVLDLLGIDVPEKM